MTVEVKNLPQEKIKIKRTDTNHNDKELKVKVSYLNTDYEELKCVSMDFKIEGAKKNKEKEKNKELIE